MEAGSIRRGDTTVFEEVRLLGPTERSIVVQTRRGRNIDNVIEPDPGFQQRRFYALLL